MALTLKVEQRLKALSLTTLYTDHEDLWRDMADHVYLFVRDNFPAHSVVRPDDVRTALRVPLEVDPTLLDYLKGKKKRENYWIDYFGDYIIDKQWTHLTRARP